MAKDKKKAAALPEGDDAAPKKKSGKKKIVIILVLLLLILSGAGAGVYWWFFLRAPGVAPGTSAESDEVELTEPSKKSESASEESSSSTPKVEGKIERQSNLPRSKGVVVPMPPIRVNLFDAGGRRYLKLGMEVEANRDISKEIKANESRIRDAVIMLLAGKTYADIASPEGKVMLKAEVANRLTKIIGKGIIRIYFTDFVVE